MHPAPHPLIREYIKSTKVELRERQNVQRAFCSVRDSMRQQVEQIHTAQANGKSIIPELAFQSIKDKRVGQSTIDQIRQRGCVVIRGVFSNSQAVDWNDEIGHYLADNHYLEKSEAKAGLDNYFGDLAAAKPQIFGIYWSRPQVMARQSEAMAQTKQFLNRLWSVKGPMGDEFDPDHDYSYADRTRRRAPGDTTLGLSPHMDAGSYERWVDPAFQRIYADVFNGRWQRYDPWSATFRTQTREYASAAVCSMFRTFQGWTALTPQGPGDGTLKLLPIANSIAYTLLRSLQDDIADDELCLANPGRALGVDAQYHPDLTDGLVSIPAVQPGDTVWWHPDVVHAVENEHHGKEYASVIYIGASPACTKNQAYAQRQLQHFLHGKSAPDFAAEDYETNFKGRAKLDDLTKLGQMQMGL